MNREIKFRAFIQSNKEMRKVETIYLEDEYVSVYDGDFQLGNAIKIKNSDCELMQFTGLKDKYSKEIYEGDVLKCYDYSALDQDWNLDKIHIGVIEWTAPQFSLKIPGKQIYDTPSVKQKANDVFLDYWDNAEHVEVIGNIYENPELLN